MRRREFLTLIPGATLALTGDNAAASPIEVNVKRDFGAKGDGTSDDWQAIENANAWLAARGGGRMYFPEGRYRLPDFAKNIVVRNNVEYYGDGYFSVILGSNCAFTSPNGAAFGRGSYGKYTYAAAQDVRAGDRSVKTKTAGDTATFSAGDIVIIRSTGAIEASDDIIPHYVEMNRITAVADGVITLEDPIDDSWNGVIVARVSDDVSQGYRIHNLRIECDSGYPLFIQASYKALIRNCWTRGFSVLNANAFTRSVARDISATVLWSARGTMASPIEIETGSVGAVIRDVDVKMSGTSAPGKQAPLIYCQEFSRRTAIENVRIHAGGLAVGNIVMAMAGGHSFANIHVTAKAFDKALDYLCGDPRVFSLNHLPLRLKGLTVDAAGGFGHGFVLNNPHPGGTVENVTVQDCAINGAPGRGDHNLIWLFQGAQSNILFENVSGEGDVRMNADGLPTGKGTRAATLRSPLRNVEIRACNYRRIASKAMLEQATFTRCRRINSLLPTAERLVPAAWTGSVANTPVMKLVIPANATVCAGDHVVVNLAGSYGDAAVAHIAVKAFGAIVATLDLRPSASQAFDVSLRLDLAGASFVAPDKYLVAGTVAVNGVAVPLMKRNGTFDANLINVVEVQARLDRKTDEGSGLLLESGSVEYVRAED